MENYYDWRKPLPAGFKLTKKITITSPLARGGSSLTYSAVLDSGERVVIKEIYPYNVDLNRDENYSLFLRKPDNESFNEIQQLFSSAAKQEINNVMSLYISEDSNSPHFYPMQDISEEVRKMPGLENTIGHYTVSRTYKGHTLSDLIYNRKDSRMSLSEALNNTKKLLQVLDYVHSKGFIHNDVKPNNCFMQESLHGNTNCVLLDCSNMICIGNNDVNNDREYLLSANLFFSSPESSNYMYYSRSQEGKENNADAAEKYKALIGPWSDIYSVGICLLYMIMGKDIDLRMQYERLMYEPGNPQEMKEWISKVVFKAYSSEYISYIQDRVLPGVAEMLFKATYNFTYVKDSSKNIVVTDTPRYINCTDFIRDIDTLLEDLKDADEKTVLFADDHPIDLVKLSESVRIYAHESRALNRMELKKTINDEQNGFSWSGDFGGISRSDLPEWVSVVIALPKRLDYMNSSGMIEIKVQSSENIYSYCIELHDHHRTIDNNAPVIQAFSRRISDDELVIDKSELQNNLARNIKEICIVLHPIGDVYNRDKPFTLSVEHVLLK